MLCGVDTLAEAWVLVIEKSFGRAADWLGPPTI